MEVIDKMITVMDVIMASQWIFVPVLLAGGLIGNALAGKLKKLGGSIVK